MVSCSKTLYLLPVAFLAFILVCVPGEVQAGVGINVNINLGPPPIVVAEPPAMVIVPNSRVYFVPDPEIDVFFYDGYWWSPRGTRWYRASAYRGPWVHIHASIVPSAVVYMPRDYRIRYARAPRVKYVHWQRDLSRWERANWKAHQRWEKEREKEWRRTARDKRYDRHDDHRKSRWDRPDDRRDDRRNDRRDSYKKVVHKERDRR